MIIVNARFLTQPVTGVQRFAIEISKIIKKRLGDKVHFITHPGILHHKLAEELKAEVIGLNRSHIWEQIDLPLYLSMNKRPLLISFGYTGPLFYRNQIVSIHDMAFKYYKETFSKSFSYLYNFLVPKIAKKCLHVFTVSKTAKNELAKELGIPKEKITVVYNGLSDVFKTGGQTITNKEKYILTVSSHHPRKNYPRLLEAFSMLDNKSIKLYVVGNEIKHFSSSMDKLNDVSVERVKFLTNISDELLSSYYENAELFVFPSLYEGFGIPLVEAMGMRLKCVISDIPVFREIAKENAIFVNPKDVESIKEGIEIGLKLDKNRMSYDNMSRFSWNTSANKVLKLLNQIEKQN
ncbi:glycosyltransferase family 4 protein [Flagellimonas meridianipacifica]|uniref:Glycosyltransferase involved in cell wall biosynthesis n=1 Tax=Flagellimonas meridianipacifica TaxID=1080225 RepID=A0A2T0MH84_9FLAO|nr:glycosyltransferase family 1 protein [Allomuricauda pacifica]PRX56937.1 glycosyltransferase involved in cell wall biosynthesis [Allomuricauda pacifica]